MAFKKKTSSQQKYDNPEALFRDRRNRTVQGLLSHQSDMVREYNDSAIDKKDIAFELPTGSGKTLVGLLIAEFRRVTKKERVIYLCPTKQLVQQVCEQSRTKYGIEATPFVGKKSEYNSSDKVKYMTAQTIAVTTYSALFNSNPFFNKPQVIILDDAHAAENYIASAWSLSIDRRTNEVLYLSLLSTLDNPANSSIFHRFASNEEDFNLIEKLPSIQLLRKKREIQEFLNENLEKPEHIFPWGFIKNNLDACHVFVSLNQILIRPYIPPTLTHEPFAHANQRVFMSATLGNGGDLERITGIDDFYRLPIPTGWDKQGIGRRYFIFPSMSEYESEVDTFLNELVPIAERAIVLTPSHHESEKYEELLGEFTLFNAKDIEESKTSFINSKNAVALLANRYDGIDLPNEECRLLIIEGLPKAGNLQEKYLMSRMVAGNLFKDRIRTRIIQAFGRCTRSDTDYAAIVILGEDFFDWLVLDENRSLFHPELQGELKFGIDQATGITKSEQLENISIFLNHDSDWMEVDSDIREMRDSSIKSNIPGEEKLLKASELEVKYQYSLWNCDFDNCAELAHQISEIISGPDLKGLRGFWKYLSASAYHFSNETQENDLKLKKAFEMYEEATKCLPATNWLRLLKSELQGTGQDTVEDGLVDYNVERIEAFFEKQGFASPLKFETYVKSLLNGINSKDSNEFEFAHQQLGDILGFDTGNSKGHATPDPWWIVNEQICIVSEDKSDAKSNAISVKYTRQAASHSKWIKENILKEKTPQIFIVFITPQEKIHSDVPIYAEDVYYLNIDDFRKWTIFVIRKLRELRTTFTGEGNQLWRDAVKKSLLKNHIDPDSIVELIKRVKLRDVEIE